MTQVTLAFTVTLPTLTLWKKDLDLVRTTHRTPTLTCWSAHA